MIPPDANSTGRAEPFRNEKTPEVIVVIISFIYLVWNKGWFNINKVGMYIVGER